MVAPSSRGEATLPFMTQSQKLSPPPYSVAQSSHKPTKSEEGAETLNFPRKECPTIWEPFFKMREILKFAKKFNDYHLKNIFHV